MTPERLHFSDFALPARERGMSPETFANLRRHKQLIGGYFYPLDAARALDLHAHREYLERSVTRVLREPLSARNLAAEAAQKAAERRVASAALGERVSW